MHEKRNDQKFNVVIVLENIKNWSFLGKKHNLLYTDLILDNVAIFLMIKTISFNCYLRELQHQVQDEEKIHTTKWLSKFILVPTMHKLVAYWLHVVEQQ